MSRYELIHAAEHVGASLRDAGTPEPHAVYVTVDKAPAFVFEWRTVHVFVHADGSYKWARYADDGSGYAGGDGHTMQASLASGLVDAIRESESRRRKPAHA